MAKLNDKMFNRVIEGRLYSDKGVPLDTLFDNVVFDESTNTTEVGGNLEVDGTLKASGGEEVITDIQAVIDEGNPQLNLKQGNTIVNITDMNPILAHGEKMTGFSFIPTPAPEHFDLSLTYAGIDKNANQLTIVVAGELEITEAPTSYQVITTFEIPQSVADKIFPSNLGAGNYVDNRTILAFSNVTTSTPIYGLIQKTVSYDKNVLNVMILTSGLNIGQHVYFRYEATLLLSNNLISGE